MSAMLLRCQCVKAEPIGWKQPGFNNNASNTFHDDVIKWKHFPRYWSFVRGIHRSPVNSPHKGQWRGALMFSLICTRINGWVNNGEAGDLRRRRAHYDVTVMVAFLHPTWDVIYKYTLKHPTSSACFIIQVIGRMKLKGTWPDVDVVSGNGKW